MRSARPTRRLDARGLLKNWCGSSFGFQALSHVLPLPFNTTLALVHSAAANKRVVESLWFSLNGSENWMSTPPSRKPADLLAGQAYSRPRPSGWVWFLCLALVALSFLLDDPIRALALRYQEPAALEWARNISHFSELQFLLIPALAALIYCHRRRHREAVRILWGMILGSLIAGAITLSIRCTTGRTRPCAPPAITQGFYGLRHNDQWLLGAYDYNSFPSGHTGAAMGFVAVLVFARPLGWWWLALAAPALVAWSRVYLDRHHFSDVVFAAFIGLASGWAAAKLAGFFRTSASAPATLKSVPCPAEL